MRWRRAHHRYSNGRLAASAVEGVKRAVDWAIGAGRAGTTCGDGRPEGVGEAPGAARHRKAWSKVSPCGELKKRRIRNILAERTSSWEGGWGAGSPDFSRCLQHHPWKTGHNANRIGETLAGERAANEDRRRGRVGKTPPRQEPPTLKTLKTVSSESFFQFVKMRVPPSVAANCKIMRNTLRPLKAQSLVRRVVFG